MTYTFKPDLDRVQVNQHAKYLDKRSYSSKVIAGTHRHTHIHWKDCSTWTTKGPSVIQSNMSVHHYRCVMLCFVNIHQKRSVLSCLIKWTTSERTSGYTTWFTAGDAIRIALRQLWQTWKLRHYDVIDDTITRKV